ALKGNVALRDNNFILLYLGSKAVEKAKGDHDEQLVNWLQATPYGRGVLDGKPCVIETNSLVPTPLTTSDSLQTDSLKPELKAGESVIEMEVQPSEVEFLTSPLADNLSKRDAMLAKSVEEN
ncbi:MAG: hypothetical protein WBA41_08465, partial [Rivularia sp. (in: cyanobacteria)]